MNYEEYTKYTFDAAMQVKNIDLFVKELFECYRTQGTVYVIGNGGSASTASHFANDLVKGTRQKGEECLMRAVSLTDNVALMTAFANDDGYETVFSSQLYPLAHVDDVLVAISGSGNSPNIIRAVEMAKAELGMNIIGITGFDGGKLGPLSDIHIHVNLNDMCTSESIHSHILHYVTIAIKKLIEENQWVSKQ